jgi:hypothetical protein
VVTISLTLLQSAHVKTVPHTRHVLFRRRFIGSLPFRLSPEAAAAR